MPRVSTSVASHRRKKKILKQAKGFRGGRAKLFKTAKEAVHHALVYAYIGRKLRKRDFRRLWIARINAASRQHGVNYSVFMNSLLKKNIRLNRKVLADIAVEDAAAFKAIVTRAMAS
jgi:large subunit ribosomal protein L20